MASVAVVAVLAIVLTVGLVIRSATSGSGITATPPSGASEGGAITVGNDNAPVPVDLYIDYQCPACMAFEDANATMLSSMQEEGAIKIAYHPISILDRCRAARTTRPGRRTLPCASRTRRQWRSRPSTASSS